jgi:hypothetical protein
MNSYLAGTSVTLTIPLLDLSGAALAPSEVSYTVSDGEGAELISPTAIELEEGQTSVVIEIAGEINALQAGSGVEARVVSLLVTTEEGTSRLEDAYLVKATSLLIVPQTSFQSWAQAQAELLQMMTLHNFSSATREQQEAAMIEAYVRLTRFTYEIVEGYDAFEQINWPGEGNAYVIRSVDWADMTQAEFEVYPGRFRQALRRAQIAEADDVLQASSPDDKRRMGLLSESVGESSMMFRTGKPVDLGASAAALKYIGRYVRRGAQLRRA